MSSWNETILSAYLIIQYREQLQFSSINDTENGFETNKYGQKILINIVRVIAVHLSMGRTEIIFLLDSRVQFVIN